MNIEVRIKAINNVPSGSTYPESVSFFIDVVQPISASRILRELLEISAINQYINDNTIPANPDTFPTIDSSISGAGAFQMTLPSTITGNQTFIVRVIKTKNK